MTLGELAQRFNLTLSGDAQRSVSGLATLGGAGPDHVSFIASKKYLEQLFNDEEYLCLVYHDGISCFINIVHILKDSMWH